MVAEAATKSVPFLPNLFLPLPSSAPSLPSLLSPIGLADEQQPNLLQALLGDVFMALRSSALQHIRNTSTSSTQVLLLSCYTSAADATKLRTWFLVRQVR